MSEQADQVPDAPVAKTDAASSKPVKPAKKAADKEKPVKAKTVKTSFSGRVEEIAIGESDLLQFVLRDKHDKRNTFSIPATTSTAPARIQLLTTALGTKYKLHVETSPDNQQHVRSLALHAKK